MAFIRYNNVGIKAVSACVPEKIEKTDSLTYFMSKEDMVGVVDKTGKVLVEATYSDIYIPNPSKALLQIFITEIASYINEVEVDKSTAINLQRTR